MIGIMLLVKSQGFLNKARTFQSNLVYHHVFKKQLKRRSYTSFLQLNTGYLPRIDVLLRWRTRLLALSLGCLGVISLFVFVDYPRYIMYDFLYLPGLEGLVSIPILMGSGFLILFSFTMMMDFVIFRREGDVRTFIPW
jgi:hypothetical protein